MALHSTFKAMFCVLGLAIAQDVDYAQFVNPFIGSEGAIPGYACQSRVNLTCQSRTDNPDGGGDVFVGSTVPFGMVKLGIDTYEEPVNQSALNGGYTPKGYVTGVSMMHVSGTGGGPKYGFPSQMPLTVVDGAVNLVDNRTYWQTRVCTVCMWGSH
jgi:putative alpha-1,2-mannosidase